MIAALLAVAQTLAPSLDTLTTAAAPIALVRVEKLHAIDQINARMDVRVWPEDEIRIAECAVERMLLGDPKTERVFVTLRVPRGESYELAIGERVVVFGDWTFHEFSPSELTSKRLDKLSAGHLVVPLAGGIWRARTIEDREVVERPLSIVSLPKSLDERRVAAELPLATLLDWLDHEIDRTTPSLSIDDVSYAISPWCLQIHADGSFDGSEHGVLDAAALQALWHTLDEQRFDSLPRDVGKSRILHGPDFILRTRRRSGIHTVRVCSDDAIESVEEREQFERVLRIWKTVPGSKKPAIRTR